MRTLTQIIYGPVAQPGRAPPLQGGGPGFKSRWVHPYCYYYIYYYWCNYSINLIV
jgi:hypothetical protein